MQQLLNSQPLDPRLLRTSDISAISQTNPTLSGTIAIDALNLDPTQGITELPVNLVDATKQTNQQLCNISQNSSFIVTGRGGLPETPNATLKPDATWEDWRILTDESPKVLTMKSIVEAQSWQVDAQGIIHLSAKPASSLSQGCAYSD
ncbi:hypothetical protein [Chlorogloeopsis sp. ULAP02]|uniref:hypothetical protein n=1 Tax=Chlorogloeopsis sp. ULAP02 TaxID=3107926 RepID=UPI0031348355